MDRHRSLEDRIDELQQELSLMEQAYTRSLQRVTGQDREWEERKKNLIRQMCELIGQFKIGDDSTKAVAIVAQSAVMAAELRAPDLWVTKYEERKKMLTMARSQAARQEAATEKARRSYEDQSWRRTSNG